MIFIRQLKSFSLWILSFHFTVMLFYQHLEATLNILLFKNYPLLRIETSAYISSELGFNEVYRWRLQSSCSGRYYSKEANPFIGPTFQNIPFVFAGGIWSFHLIRLWSSNTSIQSLVCFNSCWIFSKILVSYRCSVKNLRLSFYIF